MEDVSDMMDEDGLIWCPIVWERSNRLLSWKTVSDIRVPVSAAMTEIRSQQNVEGVTELLQCLNDSSQFSALASWFCSFFIQLIKHDIEE